MGLAICFDDVIDLVRGVALHSAHTSIEGHFEMNIGAFNQLVNEANNKGYVTAFGMSWSRMGFIDSRLGYHLGVI